jgi:hypothetical protein
VVVLMVAGKVTVDLLQPPRVLLSHVAGE